MGSCFHIKRCFGLFMYISFFKFNLRYGRQTKQRIKHKDKIINYLHCRLRRCHSDNRHTRLCTHSNNKGKPGKDSRMPLIHNHKVQRNHRVGPDIHNRSHKAEHIHSHSSVGIHSSKVVHKCKGIHG